MGVTSIEHCLLSSPLSSVQQAKSVQQANYEEQSVEIPQQGTIVCNTEKQLGIIPQHNTASLVEDNGRKVTGDIAIKSASDATSIEKEETMSLDNFHLE